ncbi:MAG: monovalent cation/H(+) antiporter subunit G [Acidobacteriota bacterium]|nr:monovalent cation/H(+) antiporter subunit G [Acidobacteriota bacterium]
MTLLGALLATGGSALLVVAALGLFLLPDALARLHAATKAGTLALGTLLTGVALLGGSPEWWWRAGAIVLLLFVTLPISSHMLARAAARERYGPGELEVPSADAP